jgi:hypothetical protein
LHIIGGAFIISGMKTTRNFKVRFHNIDLPTTTYLVEAEDHAEVFRRFSGIIRNKGYTESRAYWRSYHTLMKGGIRNAFPPIGTKKKVRTFYFLPVEVMKSYRMTTTTRRRIEVAMEVTRLK